MGATLDLADAVTPETALDRFMAALSALIADNEPLVFGRKGAPRVRALAAAFMNDLRAVARTELSQEGAMPESVDLATPALPADATAAPGAATAPGMTISSPDVLAAMLAAHLGKGPEDYAGIYAAVLAMMTDESVEPDAANPDTGIPGGVAMASENGATTSPELVALTQRLAAVDTRLGETQAALVAEREARRRELANRRVHDDMARLNLSAASETVLLELALREDQALYNTALTTIATVPVGELGTSKGGVNLAAAEPTAEQVRVWGEMGIPAAQHRAMAAKLAGITLPAPAAGA